MTPLGLVRVLSGDRIGHRYGVGFIPPGGFMEELGAIESEPGPDRIPAWLTADGLVVRGSWAEPGASRLTRSRSILEVLARRGAFRCERSLRLAAWRLHRWRTRPSDDFADDRPSGYVYVAPGDGRLPLFEGIHPSTGDQLLATDLRQIEERGYGWARLLGYIDASAPVTAMRTLGPPPPTASVTRPPPAPASAWRPPCPGGHIDEPAAAVEVDRLPFYFRGYAMFPSESVARIEVTVDERVVGLARIGNPRPDIAALCGCSDAPISGWQYELGDNLGDNLEVLGGGPVTFSGTVYGSAGGTFRLPSRTVHLAVPTDVPSARPDDHVVGEPAGRRSDSARTDEPLNVLVITHSLTYGGAQLYLAELLERLSRQGLRFTVVSPTDGPLRERLEQAGATVHLFAQLGPWEQAVYETRVAELTAFASSRGFDLVLLNTILVFYGVEVAARLGLPSIIAVHESIAPPAFWALQLEPYDPAVFERLTWALASASKVVFEAAATRELYLPYGDPERLLALPYGIDLAAIDHFRSTVTRAAARAALGIGLDTTLILCLGTTEPRKSQAPLARAFARVAEPFPDALLALVGRGDDPYTTLYADCVEEHLLRSRMLDRVLIKPLTANPFEWHVAADVLVCASDLESLPRVILEAMAFDTLVVSTDIFGIPEVIEHGTTGLLCRSRDEDALAGLLGDALSGRPELGAIRAAAAARVREHHNADAYADAFRELIAEVVDEQPAGRALVR